jgi:hypothetical protein
LLDHIEARDAGFLQAGARIRQRRLLEGRHSFRFNMNMNVDHEHNSACD